MYFGQKGGASHDSFLFVDWGTDQRLSRWKMCLWKRCITSIAEYMGLMQMRQSKRWPLTIVILWFHSISNRLHTPHAVTISQLTKKSGIRSPLLNTTIRMPIARPPTMPRQAIPPIRLNSKSPTTKPTAKKPKTMPSSAMSGIPWLDKVLTKAAQPKLN